MAGTAFEAAIAEIDRQIEELQRARERRLRLTARPVIGAVPASSRTNGRALTGDALLAVREQEFAGRQDGSRRRP